MLLAKNHYEGEKLVKETLTEHIEYCLKVSDKIPKVFPEILDFLGGQIYGKKVIFLMICMHDLGKASKGFQQITLNNEIRRNWKFRHEILSAEFINLLGDNLKKDDKTSIQMAILGHHEKDICELSKISFEDEDNFANMFGFPSNYASEKKRIYEDAKNNLKYNWSEVKVVLDWISKKYHTTFKEELEINKSFEGLGNICRQIDKYHKCLLEYDKTTFNYKKIIYLKGILITCDHLGSAHEKITNVTDDIKEFYKVKFGINSKSNSDFRDIQKKSMTTENSLLISPTGSGKTEASFLWANEHLKTNKFRRIFYVLPYIASINGMEGRLQNEDFAKNKVDIKHSKSVQLHYYRLIHNIDVSKDGVLSEDKRKIQKIARLRKQTSKEISKPIKIVTPHQLIKTFFNVKGFETLFTEFNNSLFIIDEIHCYDEELLAMLIVSMKYIKEKLFGKLFIMSATFPTILEEILKDKLQIKNVIKMDSKELEVYSKHLLNLKEGSIEDDKNINEIIKHIKTGTRVLIICNTIKKSQKIYNKVKNYTRSILLLHSYFSQKDRNNIEDRLIKGEKRIDGLSPIQVLVATQAVEVSLDLDFDICFSELATIDALIQRFGRIFRNRGFCKGKYGLVNVYKEFDRGTDFIYNDKKFRFLDRTLEKLKEYNGVILKYQIVQNMIDYVYENNYKEHILGKIKYWEQRFDNRYVAPLGDHSQTSKEYFDQFNGFKVCPENYIEEYEKLILDGLFIEADSLLIPITEFKLIEYIKKHYINKYAFRDKYYRSHNVVVSNTLFLKYDSNIGLYEDPRYKDNKNPIGVFI